MSNRVSSNPLDFEGISELLSAPTVLRVLESVRPHAHHSYLHPGQPCKVVGQELRMDVVHEGVKADELIDQLTSDVAKWVPENAVYTYVRDPVVVKMVDGEVAVFIHLHHSL